jgi:hypothetical protein
MPSVAVYFTEYALIRTNLDTSILVVRILADDGEDLGAWSSAAGTGCTGHGSRGCTRLPAYVLSRGDGEGGADGGVMRGDEGSRP